MNMTRCVGAAVVALLAGAGATAENVDPASEGSQHVWSENAGWINAEPLGDGGPGVQVEDFELSGWMWGENVGWISLSCVETASCRTTSYGVTNDGHGGLAGFAWSENAGWVNFSGVQIDPALGTFDGQAWSENLGWISFAAAGPNAFALETSWCGSVGAAPSGSPNLVATSKTSWSWSSLPGSAWYEVVRGDIEVLRASAGDFSLSSEECLLDDTLARSLIYVPDPAPSGGSWFLVRGVNCRGKGTFDSGGPGLSGFRDPGIAASGNDCP